MTAREAIERSLELWRWLAETGEPEKYKWPGWAKYGQTRNRCFLCEFVSKTHSPCLVWPRCSASNWGCPCLYAFEPYGWWREAIGKTERRQAAAKFVAVLEEVLARLAPESAAADKEGTIG